MLQARKDVACEQVGLGGVRIAGEDESLDAERTIGVQLGQDLVLAQYTREAMLDPGTRHLRRNATPLLRDGRQVTFV